MIVGKNVLRNGNIMFALISIVPINGINSVATISIVPNGTTQHASNQYYTKKSQRLEQIVGLEFIPVLRKH